MNVYTSKIGIGITVHNRHDIAIHTLRKIIEFRPDLTPDALRLVIVDDASDTPFYEALTKGELIHVDKYYRFNKNVGIAAAKNKCLEMLEGCEHIFLFDDDVYPICDRWYEPYMYSPEPHLMYIFKDFATPVRLNDTIVLTEFTTSSKYFECKEAESPIVDITIDHVAYSHARGVMLYFHSDCLQKVGGFDPIFGRWGFEHADLSDRIYEAGLTRYRYMDVKDSDKLFYCLDEHQQVTSTTWAEERQKWIARNKEIYLSRKGIEIYCPYQSDKNNMVITTFFTGVPDPQRPNEKWEYKRELIQPLISSIEKHQQQLHILHDGCIIPVSFIGDPNVWTHKIKSSITPYFQRWISIRDYLIENKENLDKVFCVDATDVEMLKNPFPEMEYGKIYTGDEPTAVQCPWMLTHHKNKVLQDWMHQHGHKLKLLNAGLLGGEVNLIIDFLTELIDFYHFCQIEKHYKGTEDTGMTDMAAFNYIAYTKFDKRIIHGPKVNTEFKKYDRENTTAFFRHK